METERLRTSFKEWAKENGLLLIRLSSGQYNSPKTEAAGKRFRQPQNWHKAVLEDFSCGKAAA